MAHDLDRISIASPCHADWNAMQGNEQVRFCQQCQLNVYNLSGMNRAEAEALVQAQEGRLCVRFYQRQDGTLLTRDCPVGLQALHRRKATRTWKKLGKQFAAAVVFVTVAGSFSMASATEPQPMMGAPKPPVVMGDMSIAPEKPGESPSIQKASPNPAIGTKQPCKLPKRHLPLKWPKRGNTQPNLIMGKMAAPNPNQGNLEPPR